MQENHVSLTLSSLFPGPRLSLFSPRSGPPSPLYRSHSVSVSSCLATALPTQGFRADTVRPPPEKMRPTLIGLRRYAMAQEPREHCLMPWETEDNRCLKKKVFRHRILVTILSKLEPLPGNQSSYQLLPDADSATQEPGKQPRYRALSRVACAEHRSPPHFSRMSHLCEAKTVSVVWTTGSTGQ